MKSTIWCWMRLPSSKSKILIKISKCLSMKCIQITISYRLAHRVMKIRMRNFSTKLIFYESRRYCCQNVMWVSMEKFIDFCASCMRERKNSSLGCHGDCKEEIKGVKWKKKYRKEFLAIIDFPPLAFLSKKPSSCSLSSLDSCYRQLKIRNWSKEWKISFGRITWRWNYWGKLFL